MFLCPLKKSTMILSVAISIFAIVMIILATFLAVERNKIVIMKKSKIAT
jgi:hypothetical protein